MSATRVPAGEPAGKHAGDLDRPGADQRPLDADRKAARIDLGATETCPMDGLQGLGVTEWLDLDDRPTFILDLQNTPNVSLAYSNASFQRLQLLKDAAGSFEDGTVQPGLQKFWDWTISSLGDANLPSWRYHGFRWTAKMLRARWRVVVGVLDPDGGNSKTPPQTLLHATLPLRTQINSSEGTSYYTPQERTRQDQTAVTTSAPAQTLARSVMYESLGPFDVTAPNPQMPLSPHLQFFLDFDWAATELGPIRAWSQELRRMVNILMGDPRPAALYWGTQRTMMYNEPYVLVTGQKHPGMMGKSFSEAWAEIEDDFVPAFEKAYQSGKSYVRDDARFELERHGYLEETYYSLAIIPIPGDNGELAFYNPVFDTTRQVILDRRMSFLLYLGQKIAASREPKDFWAELLKGLNVNKHPDLPFALVYSAGADTNEELSASSEQSHAYQNWVLEGAVRMPDSCTIGRRRFDTDDSIEEFIPKFSDLITSDSSTLLTSADGSLPEFLTRSIPTGCKDACDSAVFLPIRSTGDNVLGFLVLGINPRKRYDEDYKVFIELLSRQLATSMASALLLEEEIRRGRLVEEQAKRDRSKYVEKLANQTHEAEAIETRFRRMADLAPVGMFHIDPAGVLMYANNDYYTMTEHPRNVSYPMSWYNVVADVDRPVMDVEWAKLLNGEAVSFELRLRRPFVAEEVVGGEKVNGSTWIIASAYAEKDADGTVIGILGCITDISRQKWAEGFQKRKLLEAFELKRQQENFIDMTSHEMRNPLSAILQCADWIGASISEFGSSDSSNITIPREVIDGYADAAQTIVLCAQHQTRIIDDILTLSKLDSDLLIITPVEVQPISVIQTGLKMFDGELQEADIDFKFHVEQSYSDLAVEWVMLDPGRLLQVLINLTTNAIKFTQSESTRKISISMGASLSHPTRRNGIEFLARGTSRRDMSSSPIWGEGEDVYLYIEVQDSGRGLDELERNLLFKRFSQASPRTHVQYGGSGLGLFISRELTELQGGQIGVSSKAGVGSTFAFYVHARRCEAPEESGRSSPSVRRKKAAIMKSEQINANYDAQVRGKDCNGHLPEQPELPAPTKHILVVEDNLVNQKILCKQLTSAGCVVSVANHGREALDFLEKSRFWMGKEKSGKELSVILMDLEMPVMDGLTCVKVIRQLQQENKVVGHVPIIAVTANARSEQISTAKEAGMDSVVTKPFRIPELIPEIERLLKASRSLGAVRGSVERSLSAH